MRKIFACTLKPLEKIGLKKPPGRTILGKESMSKIFAFLCMVIVIIFAISNKTPTILDLWPFPYILELPLAIILLVVFFGGFFVGGITNWLSHLCRKKDPSA